MKKARSGKKSLIRLFALVLAVTLLCVIISGSYFAWVSEQQMTYCNEAALNLYFRDLQSILTGLDSFNKKLSGSDMDFLLLSLKDNPLSAVSKLQAKNSLRREAQNHISAPTAIVLFHADGSVFEYQFGSDFLGGIFTRSIRDMMHELCTDCIGNDSILQRWTVYSKGNTALLINVMHRNDMYVCSLVDLHAYAPINYGENDSIVFSFFNQEQILSNEVLATQQGVTLDIMHKAAGQVVRINRFRFLVQSKFDAESGIGLCGMIPITGIWENYRIHLVVQLGALIIISIVFGFMYSYMSKMLIYPLNQITKTTKQIADSPNMSIAPQEDDLLEFQQIRQALQQLLDQRLHLEQDNLEQAYEKEHAQLQYYQLQTRSHFFINCLKSIYNLTEKGEHEKTKRIVTLFSNHLRYVFHDNLSLVTLQSELEEVDDYYRIISLERRDPILLSQNVDPGLLNVRIPPLCIQIFLENFHKLSLQNGKILRFLIRADRVELDGKQYLRIRLTDNGPGYSEEALKKLSSDSGQFEQYQVGIQNLKRRMSLIYQNQYRMAFFNNPGGGACTVMYIPMSEGEKRNESVDC